MVYIVRHVSQGTNFRKKIVQWGRPETFRGHQALRAEVLKVRKLPCHWVCVWPHCKSVLNVCYTIQPIEREKCTGNIQYETPFHCKLALKLHAVIVSCVFCAANCFCWHSWFLSKNMLFLKQVNSSTHTHCISIDDCWDNSVAFLTAKQKMSLESNFCRLHNAKDVCSLSSSIRRCLNTNYLYQTQGGREDTYCVHINTNLHCLVWKHMEYTPSKKKKVYIHVLC